MKDRGRPSYDVDLEQPPIIPPRRSSLSAPTSTNNSRTSSLTSRSDHHRTRRIAAEKDLRKTLERMESERLIPQLQNHVPEITTPPSRADVPVTSSAEPLPGGWESLRPPSFLNTPYSQPSGTSASPGPVETGEARTVNYFPHNNKSLQLIEKHPLTESVAAKKARQLIANEPQTPSTLYDSKRDSQNTAVNHSLSTPSTTRRSLTVDSPLRNPRQPPEPPPVKIVPPPSHKVSEDDQDVPGEQPNQETQLLSRQRKRQRSESFIKTLTRNFSLKNARNRKSGQDLDSQLHPFWRPRGFWDGIDDGGNEEATDKPTPDRQPASNSLGIPQDRAIGGPTSIPRSITAGSPSRRTWRPPQTLNSPSSHSSLSKLRAISGHKNKMYRIPGLPAHFRILGLRDIQDRLVMARARREDEMRERRREDLRARIGKGVIATGDSRFITAAAGGGTTTPATATATSTRQVGDSETERMMLGSGELGRGLRCDVPGCRECG